MRRAELVTTLNQPNAAATDTGGNNAPSSLAELLPLSGTKYGQYGKSMCTQRASISLPTLLRCIKNVVL